MEAEVGQFKSYLERRYPGRSTSKHYMSDLGLFQEFMGSIEARQVKTKDIERFVQQQSQQEHAAQWLQDEGIEPVWTTASKP